MQVKFKKLRPDAITPTYATDGSAGLDFYVPADHVVGGVLSGRTFTINTGISVDIPHGFALLMLSRSGHGFKHQVRLTNCVGLIDSDYRGEISIQLMNDSEVSMLINPGDRIAQGVIVPVPAVELVEVEELSETARGEGGFGSTGK